MGTKYLGIILSLSCAIHCHAREINLIDGGTARCHVTVAKDAPPSAQFGAEEIARCFEKATGAKISVLPKGEGSADGTEIAIEIDAKLPEEGFAIDIKPEKVTISGADPRGVLYGCYELLKRWAGMRWIVPGDDGEYCVLGGKTVTVPVTRILASPSVKVRTFSCMHDEDHLWAARNNMQSVVGWRAFGKPGGEKMRHLERMAVYGRGMSGHCLTRLMCNYDDDPKKILAEHPEYFCLVKGERKISGLAGFGPNPCTSNPEVLDRIAATIVRIANEPHGNDATVTIGNDDSMQWCECENCAKLDAPEAKGTRGSRSDRYWWTVNEIARRVWAKKPDVKLGAWAYQDFWFPPKRIIPDKRLALTISYNNQCWRHTMCDKSCPENTEMARIYEMWKPFGFRTVVNRNEFSCEGCPGGTFAPVAQVVAENLRTSKELGCNGHTWSVHGPFPDPLPWEGKNPGRYPPFNGKNLKWFACWQAMYAIARQGWDTSRDVSGEIEEANRLYYGKAWEGGMKKFQSILQKAFFGTPWCLRWPNQRAIGRCLDYPAAKAALVAALKSALDASADDPRARKHVKDVEEIFAYTWICENDKRMNTYLEADFLKRRHPLKRGGALDAKDIAEAESLAGFVDESTGKPVDGKKATFVRGAYGEDGISLQITALSPLPGERIEIRATRPDIEPAVASRTVALHGKRRAYEVVNLTIPSKEFAAPIIDGTVIDLDIVRTGKGSKERLKRFVRCRPERTVSSSFRRTLGIWQNGSLNAVDAKGKPVGWSIPKGNAQVLLHSASGSDRYVRLGEGTSEIGQGYYPPAAAKRRYRILARVRGTGSVRFWAASYKRVGGVNGYNAIIDGTQKSKLFKLEPEWKTEAFETESTGAEEELVSVRFFRTDGTELDIDDCFVMPLGEGAGRQQ